MSRRRSLLLQAAAGGFDPLSISGCTLWLDAADASTFAYGSGTEVATWSDKSPSGFDVAQSTAAKRPTRDRTVNGITAVDFVAADKECLGLNTGGASTYRLQNASNGRYTAFTVWVSDDVTLTRNIFDHDNAATRIAQFMRTAASKAQAVGFPVSVATGSTTLTNGTTYVTSTMANGSNLLVRLNGSAEASSSLGSPVTTAGRSIGIGCYEFGAGVGEGQHWDGAICEIICYDSALSDTDRDAVTNYLLDKWT